MCISYVVTQCVCDIHYSSPAASLLSSSATISSYSSQSQQHLSAMCHMCTAGTRAHMLEMRVHESWQHTYCIDAKYSVGSGMLGSVNWCSMLTSAASRMMPPIRPHDGVTLETLCCAWTAQLCQKSCDHVYSPRCRLHLRTEKLELHLQ